MRLRLKLESGAAGPHLSVMKPTFDQYQTELSRQPDRIQRYIRRGEALGRLLLRLCDYLHRLYRRVQSAAHGGRQERRSVAPTASVVDTKSHEQQTPGTQERRDRAANDEDYRSVA